MSKKINSPVLKDSEIVSGILIDSKASLNQLYQSFYPMVLQLILNNNGTEEDAKDVFQESIIVLYDKIKGGSFELSSKLKTFIYAVCKHLWLKKLKHKDRSLLNSGEIEDLMSFDKDLEHHEEKEKLFSCMEQSLGQLGEPCRAIIEDYYIHSKSMQEISDKCGYTNADNAKTQKYKCLQRLKKIFFKMRNE